MFASSSHLRKLALRGRNSTGNSSRFLANRREPWVPEPKPPHSPSGWTRVCFIARQAGGDDGAVAQRAGGPGPPAAMSRSPAGRRPGSRQASPLRPAAISSPATNWRGCARNFRRGDEAAPAELEEIGDFIARDSPASAARVVSRILGQCDVLCDHPHLGRPGRVPGTRWNCWRFSAAPGAGRRDLGETAASARVMALAPPIRNSNEPN